MPEPEYSPAELLSGCHDGPDPTGPLVDWEPAGDRTYKLRGIMSFHGAPVDWNARAVIWAASDRRELLRHWLRRLGWNTRQGKRLSKFLLDITDNRDRGYVRYRLIRRWLNTDADVEARRAWMVACKYWRNRA